VLDECDEMLNMGFAEDVETILASAVDSAAVQTMLFSATMPSWVKGVQAKYLRQGNMLNVDLVGNDAMKASRSVAHKILYVHWSQRADIIKDLVACYGFSGVLTKHPGFCAESFFVYPGVGMQPWG
jgi:ATP-dependent RNA helicase DDX21